MTPEELLDRADSIRSACEADPGLWNILRAEEEWVLFGDACDPLSPSAPERALKALQRDIYLELWDQALAPLPKGARCFVAGGGTGRFAQALVQRGFEVELVDASPHAVARAREHLGASVKVSVADLNRPDSLPRCACDLVLAVEVACYATEPLRMMTQLASALRPGGVLLYSVEARPGALLADHDLSSPEAVASVLGDGVVTLPGLKHVHYYEREEAGDLATRAGLVVRRIDGVCYVPDGPFGGLVDASRLGDPAHVAELRAIERKCREHPILRELPRAWAIVAQHP